MSDQTPVTIVMIEDDEGHARLIERNIRRAGVNNTILPFRDGTSALEYRLGADGSGEASASTRAAARVREASSIIKAGKSALPSIAFSGALMGVP